MRVAVSASKRGSALVVALFSLAALAALGSAFLTISTSTSKRQRLSIESQQAFYLAEAGLAEAFQGVRMGRTGTIGSETAPAAYGDGLLWVTATDTVDGQVRLEATGLYGRGRSTLSFVVEPVEIPLGFFSDEDLIVESVLMVDGFDSEEGAYETESFGSEIEIDPNSLNLNIDTSNQLLFYEGTFYRFHAHDGSNTFVYDHAVSTAELEEDETYGEPYDIDAIDFHHGYIDDDYTYEYQGVKLYFDAQPLPEEVASDPGITLGPTTGQGGLLGSNQSVRFQGPEGEAVAVYGDVRPGPSGSVVGVDEDVTISGSTDSRGQTVDLPEVVVPQVALDAGLVHRDPLPLLISGGTTGYDRLEVAENAEVVVRGPATLVIGELVLSDGATLTLDTRDGDVELYVTAGMDLQAGSIVETTEDDPSEVSVQVAEIPRGVEAAVQLEATSQFHGTIFAPDADVYLGGEFEVYGGVVARRLEIGAGAKLHFDNAEVDGSPIPRVVSWRITEIPRAVRGKLISPHLALGVDPDSCLELSDAHDLDAVEISVVYETHGGAQKTYTGPESGFDWDQVGLVVLVDRTPTRESEESDSASNVDPDPITDPSTDPDPDPGGGSPDAFDALGPARDEVIDAITSMSSGNLRNFLEDQVPLNEEEVIAFVLHDPGSVGKRDILVNSGPLTDESLRYLAESSVESQDIANILIANSPLSTDLLGVLSAGGSTMKSKDLNAVLDAQ